MAYPGENWRKLSYSVFQSRLSLAVQTRTYLHGTPQERADYQHNTLAAADNREILVRRRFRYLYPEE